MALAELLDDYRDGDERGWEAEFQFLRSEHADQLVDLRNRIIADGIQQPITLGPDGRVWDGHHRLCVAYDLGLTSVPVAESS